MILKNEHALEFLLAFDGRVHWYADGYRVCFEIRRIEPTSDRRKAKTADHWHRSESDRGRPYVFTDAATLIDDFFNEVERVLAERGIPFEVLVDE